MGRRSKRRRLARKNLEAPGPNLPSRFAAEQTLRDLHKLLGEREFENQQEVNAYLDTLMADGLRQAMAGRSPSGPERAQELAYQAMDAAVPSEAVKLARQAVELDPDCVDALRILALYSANSRQEYIENLFRTVETGSRALGSQFFEENRGHFWGILETRPYMRARQDLAEALRKVGRTEEAISHFEAMLDLNPNDNQGCRDVLLGCYLLLDRLDGVRRLQKQYREDSSAVFCWARVLERYLSSDMPGAAAALEEARKKNTHVEAYLTGRKKMPQVLPEYYTFGDENEAVLCVSNLGPAWQQHPPALEWLKAA